MVSVKCAGVGVAKIPKNTHVRCGSVRSEKLLCAECAVVPNLLHTNTLIYFLKFNKCAVPNNSVDKAIS